MFELLRIVLIYHWSLLGRRHEVALEVLALRHQIMVLKRRTPGPKLRDCGKVIELPLVGGLYHHYLRQAA